MCTIHLHQVVILNDDWAGARNWAPKRVIYTSSTTIIVVHIAIAMG